MEIFIKWNNFINFTLWLFDSVLRLENTVIAHPSMMARVVFKVTLHFL